jgi:hypothetical protein
MFLLLFMVLLVAQVFGTKHLGSGMFWVCFRCKVPMLRMILITMKLCRIEVIVN